MPLTVISEENDADEESTYEDLVEAAEEPGVSKPWLLLLVVVVVVLRRFKMLVVGRG